MKTGASWKTSWRHHQRSAEQSTGIQEVNRAVTQMDAITQQNAVLVEQAAAAAESLREQAHGLAKAVSMFRLRAGSNAGAASAAQRTRLALAH